VKFDAKELIIFDLDGTLIDSVPDLATAVNQMQRDLGREVFSEDLIRSWVGNGAQTLVKRALSADVEIDKNLDDDLFTKALAIFLAAYKEHACVKTKTYPNVGSTLKALHENGYKMAIVTNKPYAFVAPILETLKLQRYFSLYLGGDSLPEKKPHPEPLLYVCDKMGYSVKQALMVGDSKNDILAANAAGMQSIAVSYGYNYGEDISAFKPDVVVDDFADILESFS
jgi:phosphoglycolate phosphatase